jgi:hypothetical protein
MQGLLALAWLSPKEPNFFDQRFGKYADFTLTRDNQLEIATWMAGFFLLALLWRAVRKHPFAYFDGKTIAQQLGLDASLRKVEVVTWGNRVVTGGLLVLALIASVNYFVGTRNDGVYLHRWDAFHTVIGVKYHPELGYFDLYKCSYAIDKEGPRHFRTATHLRDLRTLRHVAADEHIAGNDCKERFTPERLEEFRHDLDQFGQWSSKRNWKTLFKDKGFNGTPFYSTVIRVLLGTVEVTLESLRQLAYIDPILMMIAFGVVGWAYGARTAAIVAIFFCVWFPNRFTHMGGSILRFDYAATLLIAFAALKKDKWGLAGGMFAWATMIRVFPAIFAVGVGLKIAVDVLFAYKQKSKLELRPEHIRFFGFYFGLLALFFVISLIGMDGGFDNWRTWAENMRIHNAHSASFRVGFKHLFMFDGTLTGTDYDLKQANLHARQNYYWLASALLFAPLLLAVRRLDTVSFAALFGVLGFFVLTFATRYYYGIVAIVLLVDRDLLDNRFMLIIGGILFAATGFDFVYFALNDSDALMYNIIVTLELTLVFGLFAAWLLTNPALLDVGVDPRTPAHVPAALGARALPVPLPSTDVPGKRESDIDTLVTSKPEPEPSVDGDAVELSTSTKRLLAEIAASQAAAPYADDAVTVSDFPPTDPDAVTISDRPPQPPVDPKPSE